MNIQAYLRAHGVPFTVEQHAETFDAQHLAHALHEPGRHVAKTVLLRADHDFAYLVALLPATHHVDLALLSQVLGGAEVHLATEAEIDEHCPDCEQGVLPPFGSQYDMQTIVDESLTKADEIIVEGSTHHEAIRLKYHDFHALESPLVASFAVPG